MTRFARATGSKASNSRVVEDATSWLDMKKQLIESQGTTTDADNEIQQKIAKAKKKEAKANASSEWAEFDSGGSLLKPAYLQKSESPSGEEATKKTKQKKTKVASSDVGGEKIVKKQINASEGLGQEILKKKRKRDVPKEGEKEFAEAPQVQKKTKATNFDRDAEGTKKNEKQSNLDANKFSKPQQQQPTKRKRVEKEKEGTDPKRRKPLANTIFVDGREIEIEIYDGFPVLKEDAVRLRALYKKMLKEGVPKGEARKAMKLERRRAEKALSREKKKVCFHCRQSGHMMTDCPKMANGSCEVCFKCGSTEHKSPQCKVAQGDDFKFSTCFVCGESGHISRQCPDNPRGLYPQGGGCRICGDVTHLKRDCPQLVEERQEKTVTVGSAMNIKSIEDLDEKRAAPVIRTEAPKQNKIIKF